MDHQSGARHLHGQTEKGWSAKTVRNQLQAISSFLDWCVAEEVISKNHAKSIPRPKLPQRLPKALSQEEAQIILTCAKNAEYPTRFQRARATAIIGCFLYTGIRLNELYQLQLTHIDLNAQTLFVSQGKGDKDRLIPLAPQAIRIFKTYLLERRKLNPKSPYFFTSVQDKEKMGDNVIKRLIEKLRILSKVNFSAHVLRHTFATLMLQSGCDLFSIQKMMGHSDIATTSIYLKATVEHLRNEIAKHPL
ncbi:tyrosine-type recombinase/integrase [Terasakiella sp. SH-1]|uniref:tyrosine-type recombinase/integrase n=1 Tax=Terasakiella sp. SH-1 TaxID=2560057 RepID=UPI001073D432|nr:tyrosine-type recombinase/integrase [Terasakiella sp. SH-1]